MGEMEKKAWTTYFEDGLWDIFFAIMMLTMAFRTLTNIVWFTPLMFVGVLFFIIGKKRITIPRLGHVKFNPKREVKRIKLFIIIFVAVCSTFILLLLPILGIEPPREVGSLFMAVFLMVIFGAMAYYLDFRRLYIYGLMFAITEIVWGRYGVPAGPYVALIFGCMVLITGLILLASFIHKYQKPAEEVANGL